MLKDQMVDIYITHANHKHFKNKGYEIKYHIDKTNTKRIKKQTIQVKAEDLPTGSHTLVKVKCANCGDIIEKEYRHAIKDNNFCSTKCKGEYMSKSNFKSFEKLIGEKAYTYLYREYIENKKTLRQISKNVYGHENNFSSIGNWCEKSGIQLRHGGEAIKTQWIDNDKRRKQASELAKKNLNNPNIREKIKRVRSTNKDIKIKKDYIKYKKLYPHLRGKEFMQLEEYREKQRLSKLGSKNGMYGVTGERHPNWNPNRTHEQRVAERKTYKVSMWRKEVFKRDNYICKCCGYDKGGILVAHHIYSYHEYEELRTEVSNGITLCEKCHKEFHGKYGYGNNTKEQFEEFIKARF